MCSKFPSQPADSGELPVQRHYPHRPTWSLHSNGPLCHCLCGLTHAKHRCWVLFLVFWVAFVNLHLPPGEMGMGCRWPVQKGHLMSAQPAVHGKCILTAVRWHLGAFSRVLSNSFILYLTKCIVSWWIWGIHSPLFTSRSRTWCYNGIFNEDLILTHISVSKLKNIKSYSKKNMTVKKKKTVV